MIKNLMLSVLNERIEYRKKEEFSFIEESNFFDTIVYSKNNIPITIKLEDNRETFDFYLSVKKIYYNSSYDFYKIYELKLNKNELDKKDMIIDKFVDKIYEIPNKILCVLDRKHSNKLCLISENQYKLNECFLKTFQPDKKCVVCMEYSNENLVCNKEHICCFSCRIKILNEKKYECPICRKYSLKFIDSLEN